MKKLTIGSLKYGSVKSTVLVNSPVIMEKPRDNNPTTIATETNKVVDISQNGYNFKVEVIKGQSLLDAALEQNMPLNYSCKKGTCGKCKVSVINGEQYLQPVNNLEEKKLHLSIKNGHRLACQAIVK
ncbi:2Fe-2S iron-sulfur cluster-binding protein [Niallia endozanthoxylica]|uniref:2Fe-2S iron-sulfur cluster binding domain-containing protein n=1 Tax=Niallia endozanthoxylica TaxID=2036016 RepID=A0A5J5HBW9_9BACI|nr:2Fe-2S iron-sulfur cluster binding domain-containing protein [Niallia endozanthoxylica]KAA9017052.1 2Fe-2S iron-sulfur cluster binding domain-containing protein [Niallia endozanthoxylica]